MKTHGVYFVEGDDMQRSFLQANGGDCSILAIQLMFKSRKMALVKGFVLIACAYERKTGLVKYSSQGCTCNSFSDLS